MGLITVVCRVIGIVIMLLAFGCTLVSVGTWWLYGHITSDGQNSLAPDEYVYLSLWRRELDREPGTDESDTWRSHVDNKGRGEEYCPERNGQTYDDAFIRIQAAQACAIIALIFSFFTLIGAIVSMLGRIVSRAIFAVPAVLTIAAAIGTIIAWMEFYNMCDDTFCQRYLNQQGANEGECGMSVGYAFMLAAMALTFIGLLPLCAVVHRHRDKETVVVQQPQPYP